VLSRFPIRWRLALISAGLTFLILLGFALVIGQLTVSRIRSDFRSETKNAAADLSDRLLVGVDLQGNVVFQQPDLRLYAGPNDAAIRIFDFGRRQIAQTPRAPDLGPPTAPGSSEVNGYQLETRYRYVQAGERLTVPVWIEYARPLRDLNLTIARVRLFLAFGVFGGTLLALLGALALARRSLRPVTDITATAREIARTGDPALTVPQPRSDDEVAELARTFEEMLEALEKARLETEGALDRQREFVADASHELRTPLTSVLANLELLSDELHGDSRDAAEGALRSARRMRRLVADLLLLARSDTDRERTTRPLDLGRIALDAVGEANVLAEEREIEAEIDSGVIVVGARDELHRLALNLVENAVHHTPPGTAVRLSVHAADGWATLRVADDGPGVRPELRPRIFERFVSAAGDRGGSTGLGLAIVRAVAQAHGGEVELEDTERGASFVVRLPLSGAPASEPTEGSAAPAGERTETPAAPAEERVEPASDAPAALLSGDQTSTTTGSTIGRLRRRS
jgi:signal transduction histidine kinase